MEYLMTYGWSILIIAIVLGALFQLGAFSSVNLGPRAPAGNCKILRVAGTSNLEGACAGVQPQSVAQFNGASSYVNIPPNANWYSNTITISFWMNPSSYGAETVLGTFMTVNNFMFYRNSNWVAGQFNYLRYYTSTTQGIGGNNILTGCYSCISLNAWYHIVLITTTSGSTATANVYVNGALTGTAHPTDFISWYQDTTQPLYIGRSAAAGAYFNGYISNVQIYNISLDQSQITALYLKGIGAAPVDPVHAVGWWPLNGDTNDYSGNNNNGAPTAVSYTSSWTGGYTPP
jgi:Concanavalin A-like lectin/glucanases superfamily